MSRFDSHLPFFGKEGSTRHGEEDRFRAIFELAADAQLIFDDDGRFIAANAAAADLLGVSATAIVGQRLDKFIALPAPENVEEASAVWAGLLAPGHQFRECEVLRPDGERRTASCRVTLQFVPGFNLCQMEDLSARIQVENSYRTLIEITNTGYAIMDPEGRVVDANPEYVRLTGHTTLDQIVGRSSLEWTMPADQERSAAHFAACAAGTPTRDLEVDYGAESSAAQPVELNASAIDTPEGIRVLALCRDISGRRVAQQALRAAHEALEDRIKERTLDLARANAAIRVRALRHETVAQFGHRALMGASADALMREAVELIGRTLEVELCEVLELIPCANASETPRQGDLLMRAVFGWPAEWLDRRISHGGADTLESCVLRAHAPVVFEDLATEARFQTPESLRELGVVSGLSLIINGETRPFGFLGVHSRQRRAFTNDDVYFVQSMANVLAEVIERQHGEDAIRKAQHEATLANNAKNGFLSRMSHELRTPLNAILGFSQLLEIDELGASQRESVDQIIRAGRHLLEMVNEVLDIARIESGHLALSLESVSLRQLARETVDLNRPLADERRINLFIHPTIEENAHYVLADRQRLRQVVLNVISNAILYNREGGSVTLGLGAGSQPNRRRLEITDTGCGIAPDKIGRLFTPFDRMGAEKTDIEGDGVSLALSKRLMEAQGGGLGYEKLPEGSRFWMEIPSAEEPAVEELPLDLLHTLLEDSRTGPSAVAAAAAEAEVPKDHPRTVLHIEDNESNRLLVELLFVQRPMLNLVSAARGKEGLQLARDRQPDLILLDMHLPDTPGEEILHSLRADETTRATPVVVISADASGPRIRHLREAGADDYLTKPFNVGQFFRMLDEHLIDSR